MMSDVDKRSVHTDALATLGTIISENEKRDAIHIAVEPVQASEELWPGHHVAWHDRRKRQVKHANRSAPGIGIVDPFLTGKVAAGQWFWLLVYPRQITSLRHVWEHPSFSKE
jgi:hypothetical protein